LRNFRKYRHAEVEFPEGVVGVVGPNGSGKTTLFEAVAWALYGNGMSRTGGFGLGSTAAGAGAPCEAELVFERAGALFRVVRRLTYGGTFTWAQVFEGSERVADGARASDLFLKRIVGLETRPFLKILYARQGELAGLVKDTPGFRQRFITDLLGMDWLDRTLDRVTQDRKALDMTCPVAHQVEDLEGPAFLAKQDLQRLREEWTRLGGILAVGEAASKRFYELRAELEWIKKEKKAAGQALTKCLHTSDGESSLETDPRKIMEQMIDVRVRLQAGSERISRVSKCLDLLGRASAPRFPLCGGVPGPGARSRLEKQRVELLSEAAALRVRERALAGAGEGQRRRAERARLENAGIALERRWEAVRGNLELLGFDANEHEEAGKQREGLVAAAQEAAAKEATLRARLAESVRQAEQRKQMTALRSLEGLLQEFWSALIARFLPALEREVSVLLSSATAGRYTRALLDKEFNIRMEDGGRAYVLSRFSGGEQDIASLALRLGLLRLATRAPPIECVVLDEVFGSQDRERRRGVMRALLRLCPPFRQIFVVTHAEEVQDLLPHVLRVVVGPDASSAVAAR
jgi:DNA repair exonuclease SbcCD ATPase subunit